MTLLAPAVIGIAVGVIVGGLGGGGGVLTVPILVYLLAFDPHAAATASLVIVGATSLVAVLPHARRGTVRWKAGALFGVSGAGLAFLGAHLASAVPGHVLMALFALLLALVAAAMVRRACSNPVDQTKQGNGASRIRHNAKNSAREVLIFVALAGTTGLLTGFFGVGGGFVVIPALVLALGMPMREAVGTSLLVISLNSLTGLAGRTAELGAVTWPLVGIFALASMVGGLAGSRLSLRASARRLTVAFAVLLTCVAVSTAYQALPSILG